MPLAVILSQYVTACHELLHSYCKKYFKENVTVCYCVLMYQTESTHTSSDQVSVSVLHHGPAWKKKHIQSSLLNFIAPQRRNLGITAAKGQKLVQINRDKENK